MNSGTAPLFEYSDHSDHLLFITKQCIFFQMHIMLEKLFNVWQITSWH